MAFTLQCSGTSPSHSTPESFIGTSGFSPFVTAWLMRACRFSFSNSMRVSYSAMRASMRAVFGVEEGGDGVLLFYRW